MGNIPKISEAELEILKVLWYLGEATSAQIIAELKQSTTWKPKTIQTLLARLVAKGAVGTQRQTGRAFLYRPAITKEVYQKHANKSFLQRVYNGSVQLMLSSFIKDKTLSRTDIEELKKLLEKEHEL